MWGLKSPVGKSEAAVEFFLFLGLLGLERVVCPMAQDLNAWSSDSGTLFGRVWNSGDSGDGSLGESLGPPEVLAITKEAPQTCCPFYTMSQRTREEVISTQNKRRCQGA